MAVAVGVFTAALAAIASDRFDRAKVALIGAVLMILTQTIDQERAIEDVLTAEELVRMTGAYRRTSFVDAEALNGRPSYTVVG